MATILVVDDNAINRKLLVALLSADGHITLEASDGLDGLRLARAQRPQLIISDILMPTMDGYGFVRALRSDPIVNATPVIFLTAHYHEREAQKLAKACGVDRVLVKPSPAADLLRAVEQVMAGVCESEPLPEDFDREHLRLITDTLTHRVATFEAFSSRFEALARLSLELVAVQNPHTLLERVCVDARNLFGAMYAVTAVKDKGSTEGLFFATSGIDFGSTNPPAPALDAGPLGLMMSRRTPWRTSNSGVAPVDAGFPSGYPQAQAFLAAPLMTASRAYGWICLAEKIGADEFDFEDEQLLSVLAALVGRTYENLNLHLALKWQMEKQKHSERQARILSETWLSNVNRVYSLLGGMNLLIARARNCDELCKEACRLAIQHGQFRLAFIEMRNSASGDLKLVAAAGDVEEAVSLARRMSTELSAQDDLLALALSSQRPAVCNELQNAEPPVRLRNEMLDRGYRAIAALPIASGDAPVGRLVLLTEKPQFFDEAEMRLLTELAAYVSLGVSKRAKSVAGWR